jgi:uncharacterized protein YyaL (SSP411 family)
MQMKTKQTMLLLAATCTLAPAAYAASDGIGWIPTWNQALAEARQTNKPILLMSGAPECGGVPGVW